MKILNWRVVMDTEIKKAIELLNRNGYIVKEVSKAQMAIAENCKHDQSKCNFNMIGIKCVNLWCVQDMIREQILPYIEEENA